ncbi:hypothetical protein K435DRAFT_472720 [Dendrothele bispora CBS 962.96]|uniref:Uncharacterized protein n=1 Tax=Dendrothele bispora (strain CBS 962.96) TaxID=1314807 RepID=A0A4S8MC62_DENBC|nr:hypothetical protein K435DRAFT_472720 [Dendrothele bispora CBS 962.96]
MDQVDQSNRFSTLSLIRNRRRCYLTILLLIAVMKLFKRYFSLSSSRIGMSSADDISIPRMKAGLAQIGGKRDSSGLPMAGSHRESSGVSNGQTVIAPDS